MYRRRKSRLGTSWFVVILAAAGLTWFLWPDSKDTFSDAIPSGGDTIANPPVLHDGIDVATIDPLVDDPQDAPANTSVDRALVNTPQEHTVLEVKPNVVAEKPAELTFTTIPLASTTSTNLEQGFALLDKNQIVEARLSLSASLRGGMLSDSETAQARGVLQDLSDKIVFSPEIFDNDPYSIEYIIRSGDTLSGIVQQMGLQVNWRFIQRINGISKATSIRAGQNIKLVTGPFHAVVHKDSYRIDLYLGDGDKQVFVRSYKVGLGAFNSTPTGLFTIKRHSKLINPTWVHPRTQEFFAADNPLNPIGERWLGLQGIDEQTKDLWGLGIHGTIEPETIGTDSSMGCIRMLADEVAEVYEMLAEGVSIVEIR